MVAPGGFGSPNVVTEARADRGRRARLKHAAHASAWGVGVARCRRARSCQRATQGRNASVATNAASARINRDAGRRRGGISFTSSNVVAEARRYLGGNPTGRGSLWCARFEHGSAAFRLSRHRLRHGELVLNTASAFPAPRSAPSP
jgi:hypothetical protein